MHSSLLLLAAALAGSAVARSPLKKRDCLYPTFQMALTNSTAWELSPYALISSDIAHITGDMIEFGANDTASAHTFTIDTTTGLLYSSPGNLAYSLGNEPGHDAVIRFGTANVADQMFAVNVKCTNVESEGQIVNCSAPDTTDGKTMGQWNTCVPEGGLGISLIDGTSDGPYGQPPAVFENIFCGAMEITAVNIGCASSSPA